MTDKTFVVMAGGTGGHVFPGIAVAQELQTKGYKIIWLGTRKGLESTLVPKHNIDIEYINISGLRGKNILTLVLAPFKLVKAIWEAFRIFRKHKPVGALGMGGFVTGPGGIAAKLCGVPLLIHEQNAIAGLTNKILSKFANRVMQAFPDTFVGDKAITVGNPVREEITAIHPPEQRMKHHHGPLRILIVGGSLGAKALNDLMPKVVQLLAADSIHLKHQAGRGYEDTLDKFKAPHLQNVEVMEFIDDMASALSWADLVICRSGALTVTEIMNAGVASILVPFPFAVDDHQTANGRHLVANGAAQLIRQNELTPKWIAEKIEYWKLHREELVKMAVKARELAKPDSTEQVVVECMAVTS